MLRLFLSVLHLLALGIGLGAVWARARALRRTLDVATLRLALAADTWWGVAALVWISTGLWRLFGETEKAVGYYMTNSWFHTKLGLLALVLVLEVGPMIALIRWRVAGRRGALSPVLVESSARRISRISHLQVLLIVGMVIAAAAMARGYGAPG